MTNEQIKKILEDHSLWLVGEGGCRANLRGADLSRANLRDANLSGADLSCSNLRDANLSGADLSRANLRDANLRDANLRGANLRGASLSDANLSGADLSCSSLSDANLSGANLSSASLWNCSGERSRIKSIFVSDVYAITYTSEVLQIGCQKHKFEEWKEFDDRRILEMDGKKALELWREWKDVIFMIIEKSPAK
jgi:hypothetical protein